jgi:hypothetical protein
MAGILNEFVQNTKILSSKVNENFAIVQDDITELGQALNSNFSTQLVSVKNDLLTDIETVSGQKASKDLSDVEPNSEFKANIMDYVAPNYTAGYSISSGFIAPSAGWIACYGTSGEGSHTAWYVDGAEVFRDDQSWGGGRAGGQGSRSIAFIEKGSVVTRSGQDNTAMFYPCKGVQ